MITREGALGVLQFHLKVFQLALDEETHGGDGDEFCDAFRGGVGAVGGAKGVVDENVGLSGEFLGEGGIVRFFLGVVAGVLENQDFSGLEIFPHFRSLSTDAIRREIHLLAEDFGKAFRGGGERVFRIRLAVGATHVGAEDEFCAAGEEMFD